MYSGYLLRKSRKKVNTVVFLCSHTRHIGSEILLTFLPKQIPIPEMENRESPVIIQKTIVSEVHLSENSSRMNHNPQK